MNPIKYLYGGTTSKFVESSSAIYALSIVASSGEIVNLAGYTGQVLLVVNTASKCVFAKQYDALESLYQRFAEKGLVILGFPSNDFADQEPESDSQIENVCRVHHGVTFPLFVKASVRGGDKQALFRILTEQEAIDLRGEIWWNFEKFLINRQGQLGGRWRSYVSPTSGNIMRSIIKALG